MDKVDKKKSLHLRVEAGPYFLNLLMDGDAKLSDLDGFLRAIWLECCGHLSQFSYGRWNEEIRLSLKCQRIFEKGTKLWYAYDFGSTTELDIKCIDVYPVAVKEKIRILSRNEPYNSICVNCKKKPAVQVCTAHWGEDDAYFCEYCAEKHEVECEEGEYSMFPIVNSPRMGVCGYTGGMIDVERD
ncbi:MAG: hypothetical protein DHS20C18_10990 [Saprospiraceae bacterium]|nr:MAG: hypothetical protein DHS20C18_10990 [Saprospiraceae bacterium]